MDRIAAYVDRPFNPQREAGNIRNVPGPGEGGRQVVADDFPYPPPRITATPSRNFTAQLATFSGGRGQPLAGVSGPMVAAGNGSGIGDMLQLMVAQSQIEREDCQIEREDRRIRQAIEDRRDAQARIEAIERMEQADARAEAERSEQREANRQFMHDDDSVVGSDRY